VQYYPTFFLRHGYSASYPVLTNLIAVFTPASIYSKLSLQDYNQPLTYTESQYLLRGALASWKDFSPRACDKMRQIFTVYTRIEGRHGFAIARPDSPRRTRDRMLSIWLCTWRSSQYLLYQWRSLSTIHAAASQAVGSGVPCASRIHNVYRHKRQV
jgi:hypothetical protein